MNARSSAEHAALPARTVTLVMNGKTVSAGADQSLLDVAQAHGLEVPHLCHTPGLTPAGNCRVCMVEVQGERVLAASCCRKVAEGMNVQTASPRARAAQRLVLELKDKVNVLAGSGGGLGGPAIAQGWRDQVLAGLEGLGYSARDAEAACDRVAPQANENPDISVALLLRAALRGLAK